MNNKMKMMTLTILGVILLAACNGESENEKSMAVTAETEDIKELVHDYSVRNATAKSASITSEKLFVTDTEGNEQVYELPEDEFFVSIAPYINETHPCDNHSLSGCQGELVKEQFNVYIEDTEGNVIVDEMLETQANGFIDLWLPREETYQIKIEHEGKNAESEFSTFKDDGTCITTIQLI